MSASPDPGGCHSFHDVTGARAHATASPATPTVRNGFSARHRRLVGEHVDGDAARKAEQREGRPPNLSRHLTHIDRLSALVAAIIHDMGHPGVNNTFLEATKHELAILYNDVSVLENHHVAAAFKLLKTKELDWTKTMALEDYKDFRETVVGMVLGHALPMLAPGCPLVLTFKRTIPSKAAWERAMDEALAELATVADGVEVLHLLANTSRETTVVGWRRAKGPASR